MAGTSPRCKIVTVLGRQDYHAEEEKTLLRIYGGVVMQMQN
jgi:hypothetical protein